MEAKSKPNKKDQNRNLFIRDERKDKREVGAAGAVEAPETRIHLPLLLELGDGTEVALSGRTAVRTCRCSVRDEKRFTHGRWGRGRRNESCLGLRFDNFFRL